MHCCKSNQGSLLVDLLEESSKKGYGIRSRITSSFSLAINHIYHIQIQNWPLSTLENISAKCKLFLFILSTCGLTWTVIKGLVRWPKQHFSQQPISLDIVAQTIAIISGLYYPCSLFKILQPGFLLATRGFCALLLLSPKDSFLHKAADARQFPLVASSENPFADAVSILSSVIAMLYLLVLCLVAQRHWTSYEWVI